MKRKIKITEQQLNYIVENIVRKAKVNHKTSKTKYLKSLRQLNEETIDEEVLEEGPVSKAMGVLGILAMSLFPNMKTQAAAINALQQQNPEIVQMVQDTSKPMKGYDIMSDTEHGKFLKSLSKAEKNVIFGEGGFQQFFLPEIVLGTTWDSIKDGTYAQYISKLNSVLDTNKFDKEFLEDNKLGESSIKYFTDHFGEDVIRGLQQKLANSGYTQYKPDGKKGKSNIDGDFGVGTGKMIIDMMYKRLQSIKDKSQKVGGEKKQIDPTKFGDPSKGVGLAPSVQPRD
jgi:hypothetical protein